MDLVAIRSTDVLPYSIPSLKCHQCSLTPRRLRLKKHFLQHISKTRSRSRFKQDIMWVQKESIFKTLIKWLLSSLYPLTPFSTKRGFTAGAPELNLIFSLLSCPSLHFLFHFYCAASYLKPTSPLCRDLLVQILQVMVIPEVVNIPGINK